jgi:hypothetical protein
MEATRRRETKDDELPELNGIVCWKSRRIAEVLAGEVEECTNVNYSCSTSNDFTEY